MKRLNKFRSVLRMPATLAVLIIGTHQIQATTLADLLVEKGVITASELAQMNSPSGAQSLAGLLVQKGIISVEEANRLEEEPASSAPNSNRESVPSKPSTFTVKAKEKAVESLTISGRIHGQWDFLSTRYDSAGDPRDVNNLFLRRIYLGVSAKLNDQVAGILNTNFGTDAAGTGEIEKAIIEYSFGPYTLGAGYQKVPMGYEETMSSSKIAAVERSIGTRYFTEDIDLGARRAGVFFSGEYDSGFYFSLALTNPEQNSVSGSSTTDELATWAKLGWTGDLAGGSLDVGLSAGRVPETLNAGSTDLVWDLFANYKSGNFSLLTEIMGATLENAALSGGDANPMSFTIIPALKLNKRLELVARYSHLDTDSGIGADISSTFRRAPENGGARYDQVSAYYFGGNWYIRGNALKLSAGYEWAKFEDNLTGSQGEAEVDGFRTRLQLLF